MEKQNWQGAVSHICTKKSPIIILLDSLERNVKAGKAVSHLTATELNNDKGINRLCNSIWYSIDEA